MEIKICSKCKQEKPISEFGKNKKRKDGLKVYCKECRKKNGSLYYSKNKESINEKHKKHYHKNKESINERHKKWRKENKGYMTTYSKERRKVDVIYRISGNLRTRIWWAVKNNKLNSSIEYLGCDVGFYKKYLESLFTEGMSWDNYGEWHIDHIRPISSFDLLEEEEMVECFNYKNTQPLWAFDNLSKGNRTQ